MWPTSCSNSAGPTKTPPDVAGLLGFLTFLVAYFWIFSYFAFFRWLDRRAGYTREGEGRRRMIAFWMTVLGGALLWLAWTYALPDWWRQATWSISSD